MSQVEPHEPPRTRTMGYPGLAVRTGLSIRSLKRLVAAGDIPHIRYSARAVRFDREAIEQWIDAKTKRAAKEWTP